MIELLTVKEAAEILKMSDARIYELARQNLLPVVRFGRQLRIDGSALEEFIRSGGKALPGGWKKKV